MRITTHDPGRVAAAAAAAIASIVIAAALVLEHGFGYAPCPLCLEQRWPYYLGVPVAALLAVFGGKLPRPVFVLGLLVLAGLFAWGLGIGAYQAGAEWGWWMGPRDCGAGNSGANPSDVGGLLNAITKSTVVSCTDPRLRIFGISLAGWNAVTMAGLIAITLWGAWRSRRA